MLKENNMKILKKSFFIMFVLALAGCSKASDTDEYANIQDKLVNMESYSCEAEVTFYSNKGENKYTINQQAKNDGRYFLETTSPDSVKGNIILFDLGKACIFKLKAELLNKTVLLQPLLFG